MDGSIRWWTRWCAVPVLSDIPECTATLHRLGTAPRGQRGQVSLLCFWLVWAMWVFIFMTFAVVSGSCWTEHMQMWTASVRARTLTRSLCHYLRQCQALCSTAPTPVPQKLIPRTQPHVPTIRPHHHPGHHLQRHLWTSARFFWTLSLAAGGTSDHERYHITHWVKVACLSEDLGILAEPCQDYTRPVAQTPRIALAQPPPLSMVSQLFPFHCEACFFSMITLSCSCNFCEVKKLQWSDLHSLATLLF